MSADFPLHPLSEFLRPWLASGIHELNAMAAVRGLASGGGAPLRFVPPGADGLGYEERAYRRGEVETRADNRHDFFNALVWLAFPRAKALLNRRHHEALAAARARGEAARGSLRDALTQFDECGVVVAGSSPELWQTIRAHRWREAFHERRAELLGSTRFFVFGHASHDQLGAPFVGLCGKALFIEFAPDELPCAALDVIDARLAQQLAAQEWSPRDWQPLPLLGIPGATADNEAAVYFEDSRQFRPARRMPAGSPPGNR